MARNSISDLGALHRFGVGASAATTYSVLHPLMNASFTLQGVLIASGAVLARRLFPIGALASTAFLSFAISGITLSIVGLAPEDTGGQMHVLAASVHFVCGSLAMLLLGLALLRSNRAAGLLSVASGSLALAFTLLLGFRNTAAWHSLGWQIGTVERVAAYPLPLWLTLTGIVLLARRLVLSG
jgi:hypothetical membrane protein